jgi:hypothetical protein
LCICRHHTQVITLLLCHEFFVRRSNGGRAGGKSLAPLNALIAEVSTGEGKSLILAMLAVYFVKAHNKRVHILENNDGLLQRDFDKLAPFYQLFKKADGRPLSTAKGIDTQSDICYCLSHQVEVNYMQSVTSGGAGVDNLVMLVDEVDDLVIDKDPVSNYVKKDDEQSRHIEACFDALIAEDQLSMPAKKPIGCTDAIWKKAKGAKRWASARKRGTDYDKYRGQYELLDDRGMVSCNQYVLWKTYLNYKDFKKKPSCSSNYFVTCAPQIYKQYHCIFGFTGSIGGKAERQYLLDTYSAEIFTVPKFLDTCRNTPAKKQDGNHVEVYDTEAEQQDAIVKLALEKRQTVPVLIITESFERVQQLYGLLSGHTDLVTHGLEGEGVQRLVQKDEQGKSLLDLTGDLTSRATKHFAHAGSKQWRITVTDYYGGRGIDYEMSDESANDAGGLMLIITTVPDTGTREWVQWVGRTARQDKNGQWAHILCRNGSAKWTEFLSSNPSILKPQMCGWNASVIDQLLEARNATVQATLRTHVDKLDRGSQMTKLCEKFYKAAGGFAGAQWPGSTDETKFRDFLSRPHAEHTAENIAKFLKELNIEDQDQYSWECEAKPGTWMPYPPKYQTVISDNYHRKPVPTHQFELTSTGTKAQGKQTWMIDLVEMTQTNVETGKPRKIRATQTQGRSVGSILPCLPALTVGAVPLSWHTAHDRKTLDALQKCLTTEPTQLGEGRDVTYKDGWSRIPKAQRKMVVAKSWRLHNAGLKDTYQSGVKSIAQDCAKVPLSSTAHDIISAELTQMAQACWIALKEEPNLDANETLLFTGVPKDSVLQIIHNGFDERFAGTNKGSMFGQGNYFAEDAGKCDQYVTPDEDPATSEELHELLYPAGDYEDVSRGAPIYYMFVCKVCLGHNITTTNHDPNSRTVTTADGRNVLIATKRQLTTVPGSKSVHYHSLRVDIPGWRFREFVNFNSKYTYPQFLIAYKRSSK